MNTLNSVPVDVAMLKTAFSMAGSKRNLCLMMGCAARSSYNWEKSLVMTAKNFGILKGYVDGSVKLSMPKAAVKKIKLQKDNTKRNSIKLVKALISKYGTTKKVAKAVGVVESTINYWRRGAGTPNMASMVLLKNMLKDLNTKTEDIKVSIPAQAAPAAPVTQAAPVQTVKDLLKGSTGSSISRTASRKEAPFQTPIKRAYNRKAVTQTANQKTNPIQMVYQLHGLLKLSLQQPGIPKFIRSIIERGVEDLNPGLKAIVQD